MQPWNEPVATNVRSVIAKKGLKQFYVAKQAGFTSMEFSNILNNRRIVKVTEVARIAAALGVTPNDLFSEANDKPA